GSGSGSGSPVARQRVVLGLRKVAKHYGGVAALSDVSVDIRAGEVHAILGENGAGKSTLMNVASGTVQPDAGAILFEDQTIALTPAAAARLGIAIVHQHPAVLPDLTVLENLQVALPGAALADGGPERSARRLLDGVGLSVHLRDRVETLTVAQRHLLEIAKAFAIGPRVLILDEPTAPLGQSSVELVFSRVRRAVADGVAVVYITHRLAEVRELAQRVTVLRDGKLRGESAVSEITDDEMLALIVGRKLDSTFPPKRVARADDAVVFEVERLTCDGCRDVSLTATAGQILGISGVTGNGQSELLRALSGLAPFRGRVRLGGVEQRSRDLLHAAAFMPADRHREGLMMRLTVRENAAVAALPAFRGRWLLSHDREHRGVARTLASLDVRAASLDAEVSSLSGGNQQKVVVARALLSAPRLVITDEPTQGVDVGARSEIYRILREVSASGIPVIVSSSDAKELEGLCDQVVVMSRGTPIETLTGEDVNEERMITAAVRATARAAEAEPTRAGARTHAGARRLVHSDHAPAALLAAVIVALAAYIFAQNARYLSPFNVTTVLLAATALGFIALGQTVSVLLGGIDLSVGPLSGFLVVVASFFVNDGQPAAAIVAGLLLMVIIAIAVGGINGALIRFAGFTPIAATLAMYIALQGLGFVLRDGPDGYIHAGVVEVLQATVGSIPVAFVALVAAALIAELALRRRRWGWQLRAIGSEEESARRVGIKVHRTVILGYVLSSLFTVLGAVILMGQIGVGDPAQGVGYTMSSITAVVLGGTSLRGGRGSFVGTLLGAVLITQLLNATTFLGLSTMWQYVFQGLLILVAAIAYSIARKTLLTNTE
ncbi:MAG TPA: ATP-binding cassette domain-containing protein, partial [Kofleriaceae bacterium]|nr:ATP-binding cassette domain-containing protein [Kofleriaceae bacterium]